MPFTAGNLVADEQTLATTLTRIDFGGAALVWFHCPSAACYLVYNDALDDLGTVPAGRFTIPAGMPWPIYNRGKRPLVAALTGTPVASVIGEPD